MKTCFHTTWLVLSLVLLLGLAGCSPEPTEAVPPTPTPIESYMAALSEPLTVDGSDTEYPAAPFELGGVMVHLAHDGERLYVHARSEVDGWIAIGFNQAGGGMNGANMILGFAEGSGQAVRNDRGTGHGHQQVPTSGILDSVVTHSDGIIILEFSYPMEFPANAGFSLPGLAAGEEYSLIVATHSRSGDFSQKHSSQSRTNFSVGNGNSKPTPGGSGY